MLIIIRVMTLASDDNSDHNKGDCDNNIAMVKQLCIML